MLCSVGVGNTPPALSTPLDGLARLARGCQCRRTGRRTADGARPRRNALSRQALISVFTFQESEVFIVPGGTAAATGTLCSCAVCSGCPGRPPLWCCCCLQSPGRLPGCASLWAAGRASLPPAPTRECWRGSGTRLKDVLKRAPETEDRRRRSSSFWRHRLVG